MTMLSIKFNHVFTIFFRDIISLSLPFSGTSALVLSMFYFFGEDILFPGFLIKTLQDEVYNWFLHCYLHCHMHLPFQPLAQGLLMLDVLMFYCTFLSDSEQCLGFLYVKNVLVKGQLGVEAGVWVLYTNKSYVLFKQPFRQATLVEIIMINTQFKIVWQVYHQIHCTWVKPASLSATSPDDNMGKINVSTKKGWWWWGPSN